MAKQVVWTKHTLEFFIEHANLTELEANIMRTRAAEMTCTEQCIKFGLSDRTLARYISRLKIKYDVCQAQHPDKLPLRKKSAKELYMDTH